MAGMAMGAGSTLHLDHSAICQSHTHARTYNTCIFQPAKSYAILLRVARKPLRSCVRACHRRPSASSIRIVREQRQRQKRAPEHVTPGTIGMSGRHACRYAALHTSTRFSLSRRPSSVLRATAWYHLHNVKRM